jgi:translation elongation factor EF-1beta
MKTVKLVPVLLAAILAFVPTTANAWFFFFYLPGKATSKISDAITGSEGEHCVKAAATVGDILTSPSGNTATIKSLSGTSSRCRDPNLPIRALLVFNYSFSSKAGIDIPDGFEQKPLTDIQRFNGNLLKAENGKMGFFVSAMPRDASTDSARIAQAIANRMMATLQEASTSNEEELTVNGMHALRFEVVGKTKALFHPRFTYVVTLLEAPSELVVINAWTPTGDYDKNKEVLRQLIYRVSGLNSTEDAREATAPTVGALPNATKTGVAPQAASSQAVQPLTGASEAVRPRDGESIAR